MLRLPLAFAVLVASIGVACSAVGTVNGYVVKSPSCPGPVGAATGQGTCAPKPAQATIDIFEVPGQTPVASVTSNSSGRFEVSLAPGRYRFLPRASASAEPQRPEEVTVVEGMATDITLTIDTGLR